MAAYQPALSDRDVAAIASVIGAAFSNDFIVSIKNSISRHSPMRISRNENVGNALIGNFEKHSPIILSLSKEGAGTTHVHVNAHAKENLLMVVKQSSSVDNGEYFANVVSSALIKFFVAGNTTTENI